MSSRPASCRSATTVSALPHQMSGLSSGTWTSGADRQDRKAQKHLVPCFANDRRTLSGVRHACPTVDASSLESSPSGWHPTTGPSAQSAPGSPRQACLSSLCVRMTPTAVRPRMSPPIPHRKTRVLHSSAQGSRLEISFYFFDL